MHLGTARVKPITIKKAEDPAMEGKGQSALS